MGLGNVDFKFIMWLIIAIILGLGLFMIIRPLLELI